MISQSTQRALRTACVLAICSAALVVAVTATWKSFDRRPAWVMSVSASGQSESRAAALTEERAAFATAVRTIAREHGPSPEFLNEVESTDERGRTFIATRTFVLRGDDELALLALYRTAVKIPGVRSSDPQRALRPPDAAFALLLVALLAGMATLEPSDDHVSLQPALVVLNGIALGLLSAAAVLVAGGWPRYFLEASFAAAFIPTIVWLVRIRVPWARCAALRLPYTTLVVFTAVVFCAWIVRAITL